MLGQFFSSSWSSGTLKKRTREEIEYNTKKSTTCEYWAKSTCLQPSDNRKSQTKRKYWSPSPRREMHWNWPTNGEKALAVAPNHIMNEKQWTPTINILTKRKTTFYEEQWEASTGPRQPMRCQDYLKLFPGEWVEAVLPARTWQRWRLG